MNRRSLIVLLAAVMLLAFAAPSFSGVMQHPIGVQIWSPDTWKTDVDDQLLTIMSPDEGAVVMLLVLQANNLDMAVQEMDRQLDQVVTGTQVTNGPTNININGLTGVAHEGFGLIDGVRVGWVTGLLRYGRHVIMVMEFSESANYHKYEGMLTEIFKSIRAYR